jgi:quercetin dioxygenase-like cupin family protein
MRAQAAVVVTVAVLVVTGWAPAWGQQAAPPAEPKGVSSKGLVSSTGAFSARTDVPIVLTGQTIEIAPGGQTGRERYMVPAYVYVLEGTLTTDSEGGPVGVGGVQYHAAGQSVPLAPAGTWHNFYNGGQTPVKYLLLFIGTPGGPTMQAAAPSQ